MTKKVRQHIWVAVESDLRKSVLEKRPILDCCTLCGKYRAKYWNNKWWRTRYGSEPYSGDWQRNSPDCILTQKESP